MGSGASKSQSQSGSVIRDVDNSDALVTPAVRLLLLRDISEFVKHYASMCKDQNMKIPPCVRAWAADCRKPQYVSLFMRGLFSRLGLPLKSPVISRDSASFAQHGQNSGERSIVSSMDITMESARKVRDEFQHRQTKLLVFAASPAVADSFGPSDHDGFSPMFSRYDVLSDPHFAILLESSLAMTQTMYGIDLSGCLIASPFRMRLVSEHVRKRRQLEYFGLHDLAFNFEVGSLLVRCIDALAESQTSCLRVLDMTQSLSPVDPFRMCCHIFSALFSCRA